MATKSDIAEVRAEIAAAKHEIVFKLGSIFIAALTIYTAIIGLLIKL